MSAESALRGAHASAVLEGGGPGSPFPVEEMTWERIRAGDVRHPVLQGALRVSAELGALVAPWRQAPRQVLARLHVLAAADVTTDGAMERADGGGTLGRPRRDAEVWDPLSLGEAPSPEEVSARLDALAEVLTARTDAPALVVAAVVHGELLALRPFSWGNGLVARAASRLTTMARGLDPKGLACPEVGHRQLGDAYAAAARGYVSGRPDRVAEWIRHCGTATALGARESLAVCEALVRGS